MNVSDATFCHRHDVDRDLDPLPRHDPDRSVRTKRLRSAPEMTSSQQQTAAPPRGGLANKLKVCY